MSAVPELNTPPAVVREAKGVEGEVEEADTSSSNSPKLNLDVVAGGAVEGVELVEDGVARAGVVPKLNPVVVATAGAEGFELGDDARAEVALLLLLS